MDEKFVYFLASLIAIREAIYYLVFATSVQAVGTLLVYLGIERFIRLVKKKDKEQ